MSANTIKLASKTGDMQVGDQLCRLLTSNKVSLECGEEAAKAIVTSLTNFDLAEVFDNKFFETFELILTADLVLLVAIGRFGNVGNDIGIKKDNNSVFVFDRIHGCKIFPESCRKMQNEFTNVELGNILRERDYKALSRILEDGNGFQCMKIDKLLCCVLCEMEHRGLLGDGFSKLDVFMKLAGDPSVEDNEKIRNLMEMFKNCSIQGHLIVLVCVIVTRIWVLHSWYGNRCCSVIERFGLDELEELDNFVRNVS